MRIPVPHLPVNGIQTLLQSLQPCRYRSYVTGFCLGLLSLISASLYAAPGNLQEVVKTTTYQCHYHTEHSDGFVNLATVRLEPGCAIELPEVPLQRMISDGYTDTALTMPEMTHCSPVLSASDSIQGSYSESYPIVFDYVTTLPVAPPSFEEQMDINQKARSYRITDVQWKSMRSGQHLCQCVVVREAEQWAVNSDRIKKMLCYGALSYLLTGAALVYNFITPYTQRILPDWSGPWLRIPLVKFKTVSLEQAIATLIALGVTYALTRGEKAKGN